MCSRYVPLLVLALAAALIVSGCSIPGGIPGAEMTEEFDQTYPVEEIRILDIENINGAVRIRGWDEAGVSVHAVKRTLYGQEELDKVNISVERNGEFRIRTLHPPSPARVSVNYEIRIPAQIDTLQIGSSNGDVQVEEVFARTSATTSNALILMRSIAGNVEARTSNGEIEIRNITGSAYAKTSNARVTILNASVIDRIETSNGEILAEIYAINADISLQTSNAEIKVALSPELNADIEADTSNGRIDFQEVSIEPEEQRGDHLRGSIGNGGYLIALRTSNGNINISEAPLTGF